MKLINSDNQTRHIMKTAFRDQAFDIYINYIRDTLVDILQTSSKLIQRQQLVDQSNRILVYQKSSSYRPSNPHCSGSPPPDISESNREWKIPELFVADVADVELIGPDAVAVTNDGKYILENAVGKPEILMDSLVKSIYTGNIPVHQNTSPTFDSDPVANLSGAQSQAFFHWFVDYLPKIKAIEQYDDEYGIYPELLIPRDPPDWLIDSLKLLDVPTEKINQRTESRYHLDTLIIPFVPRHTSLTAPSGDFARSPQVLNWIANRLTDCVNQSESNKERILITRRDADSRRIYNEDEIITLLSDYGFTPVNLSTMSLRDQIKLFESTEYVIAPHGAGLTNIIYASNINVLEIFGDFVSPIYYQIAAGLGHEYSFVQCDDIKSSDNKSIVESRDNRDILVNKEKIVRLMQKYWDI
jgi:capsular polysaccharide biosynthesis protein